MDAWDGYPAPPQPASSPAPKAAGVENLMVLTGDVHVGVRLRHQGGLRRPGVADPGHGDRRHVDHQRQGRRRAARQLGHLHAANPHLKFYNGRRGYVDGRLGREQARADFKTVAAVTTPGAAGHDRRVLRDRGGDSRGSSRCERGRAGPRTAGIARRGSGRRRGPVSRRASASPRACRRAGPAGTRSRPRAGPRITSTASCSRLPRVPSAGLGRELLRVAAVAVQDEAVGVEEAVRDVDTALRSR